MNRVNQTACDETSVLFGNGKLENFLQIDTRFAVFFTPTRTSR